MLLTHSEKSQISTVDAIQKESKVKHIGLFSQCLQKHYYPYHLCMHIHLTTLIAELPSDSLFMIIGATERLRN